MPCCCLKIYQLCEFAVCGESTIDTGILATVTGTFKLVVDFLGVEYIISAEITNGEEIKFPSGELNENYTFVGHILKPDGTKLSFEKDTVTYDCISFKTKMSYEISEA